MQQAASSCSRRRLPVIVTGTLRRVTTGRGVTVGIIGGGQLARMMHAASIGLGVNVRLLAEAPDSSAAQVVHDVNAFDGHIACDSASQSEIVVPLIKADGSLLGVWDVDSSHIGRFDDEDRDGMQALCAVFMASLHG